VYIHTPLFFLTYNNFEWSPMEGPHLGVSHIVVDTPHINWWHATLVYLPNVSLTWPNVSFTLSNVSLTYSMCRCPIWGVCQCWYTLAEMLAQQCVADSMWCCQTRIDLIVSWCFSDALKSNLSEYLTCEIKLSEYRTCEMKFKRVFEKIHAGLKDIQLSDSKTGQSLGLFL
jgi:hypothetical protein